MIHIEMNFGNLTDNPILKYVGENLSPAHEHCDQVVAIYFCYCSTSMLMPF